MCVCVCVCVCSCARVCMCACSCVPPCMSFLLLLCCCMRACLHSCFSTSFAAWPQNVVPMQRQLFNSPYLWACLAFSCSRAPLPHAQPGLLLPAAGRQGGLSASAPFAAALLLFAQLSLLQGLKLGGKGQAERVGIPDRSLLCCFNVKRLHYRP